MRVDMDMEYGYEDAAADDDDDNDDYELHPSLPYLTAPHQPMGLTNRCQHSFRVLTLWFLRHSHARPHMQKNSTRKTRMGRAEAGVGHTKPRVYLPMVWFAAVE